MDAIIAYNEYFTLNEEITTSLDEINYEDDEFRLINYYSDYFDNPVCDICHSELEVVFLERKERRIEKTRYSNHVYKVYECPNCNWWKLLDNYGYGDVKDDHELGLDDFRKTLNKGIIKSYDIDDKATPLDVLNNEIKKNPELLYSIHPKNFELLTRDVFSEFYKCEVLHCGKSHDGGIDLLMINSDDPILIQCKRRELPDKIEPISAIREFIGALFIEDRNKGIYVTTARDFSRNTKKMIKEQLSKRKFERFDLVNYNDFVSMHNLANKITVKPWEDILLNKYEYHAKKRIEIDKYDFFNRYYHIFKENRH
jgi:hypothetical protein